VDKKYACDTRMAFRPGAPMETTDGETRRVEVAVWVVDAKALDTAGVRDGGLREDYTEQRKLVARFRRSAYLAVRLVLPTPLVPHVIAATAFMHHSDNVLDEGRPRAERAAAYAVWEKQVRDGLATGGSDHPVIRLERHSVTRADLEDARDLPGTGELLQDLLDRARRILDASRPLVELTPPANRPLVRALIALDELTIDAAAANGTALLAGSAQPSKPAAFGVLIREYRHARRLR
jgi:phytoene/squalene synthetase